MDWCDGCGCYGGCDCFYPRPRYEDYTVEEGPDVEILSPTMEQAELKHFSEVLQFSQDDEIPF